MKTISLLAAMFLIALSASPAVVAGQQVRFNGSFTSNETYDVQFPVLFVDGTAINVPATYEEQVDLFTGSSLGAVTVVAANGDVIFATQTGQGVRRLILISLRSSKSRPSLAGPAASRARREHSR